MVDKPKVAAVPLIPAMETRSIIRREYLGLLFLKLMRQRQLSFCPFYSGLGIFALVIADFSFWIGRAWKRGTG